MNNLIGVLMFGAFLFCANMVLGEASVSRDETSCKNQEQQMRDYLERTKFSNLDKIMNVHLSHVAFVVCMVEKGHTEYSTKRIWGN